MRAYVCTGFQGAYPTGTAAVIVANHASQAAILLELALAEIGLPQKIDSGQMQRINLTEQGVTILCDGNY